ncbi:MAG: autotransporter domain-containing protein [Pseudomonadota bacterium]
MIRTRILSSVGIIGIATGLAATPAFASDGSEGEAESTSVTLDARGDFQGFRENRRNRPIALPDAARLPDFTNQSTGATRGTAPDPQPSVSEPVFGPTAPSSAAPTVNASASSSAAFRASPDGAFNFALPRNSTNLASLTRPDPQIIARDDVGSEGTIDVNDTQPSVVQMFRQDNLTGGIFFNCTGSVINPRTILTAAHCVNASPSESYGLPGEADQAILISSGVDSSIRFFNYLETGANYAQGGVATSTDVVIHASSNQENGGLQFPWADIALIAVDTPILDAPALPLLLSPLSELTHVVHVGYGTFGTANGVDGGGSEGIGFLRRVGENMLGAIASPSDLGDSIFPDFAPTSAFGFETQAFYFTDFDNPDRTQEEIDGCEFTGGGVSCPGGLPAVRAIDYFEGDALPNEVATAPGDSGSPLIVDELYDFPIAVGVLSGGFDFFGVEEGYGDISFYNPLFPFFEFITENTAYKYVSANAGGGNWSDPTYWTQDLDPGFFIIDENGGLVNGTPGGSEPGVYEAGPKLGTIVGIDISGNPTDAPNLPPPGTPNFGADTPNSSVLLGPGSTGFVPQNTDGTPGEAFANPAQYFDVLLTNAGTTVVDIDVEIDKLTLDNVGAALELGSGQSLTTIIGYEQLNGVSKIDGELNAGIVGLFGGVFEGSGTINTPVVFNIASGLSVGSGNRPDELTINGDYIQSSGGALLINAIITRGTKRSDILTVNGDAGLAGSLFVSALGRPRFGDEITVLSADSVEGNFEEVTLLGRGRRGATLFANSRVEGGDVIVSIDAMRLGEVFGAETNLQSLGSALDTLRFGGRFAEFSGLFDIVDGAGIDTLIPTLSSLTPISAFSQTTIANNFSQRFTGQLAQRTLALRGAGNGAAGFSSAGNAAFAIAGTNPQDTGKLGFFGTFSGSFLAEEQRDRNTGARALEEATFTQAGEMTLGVDMHVSDAISVGVAMTSIRNSSATVGSALQRADDTSVAGAAYAAAQFGRGFADMHLGFSRQDYGVERASQGDFNLAYQNAVGAADGQQTFAAMRVGYTFGVAPGFEMGPVASVDYVRSNIGGYTEFGAGEFGLNIQGRNFTSLGTKLGAMASLDTKVGRTGTLSAFGSVAYAREMADTQDVVVASFQGAADTPFSIINQLDPQWVSVNAGAELALKNNFSVSLSATSDMGRGVLTNNQGRFTLNWRF